MNKLVYLLGAAVCMAGWSPSAEAQTASPLIEALVKKGVLTESEGSEIKKEINDDWITQGGAKLDVASHVKTLKLYGDARFRYQNDTISTFAPTTAVSAQRSRDRYRYRLRIGADYVLAEGFKAGVRLATAGAANSTNNTFLAGYAKDGLFIDRAFLEWSPDFSWIPSYVNVTLVGGKAAPQFMLDSINLDSDINPTGTSQQINYTGISDFEIGLTTAQYIYNAALIDNFNLGSAAGTSGIDGTWQIITQPSMKYTWAKGSSVQVAPLWLYNVNSENDNVLVGGARNNIINAGSGNVDVGNINILYLPVEVKWNMFKLPFKAYYTYSHNFSAGSRDRTLRSVTNSRSDLGDASDSHLIGLAVGSTRKKRRLASRWFLRLSRSLLG